ncbi:hypothetical protein [Paenibacillus periandrae]|uniref:hypothetical protein n=1 Tax=Paenibacillus periandrae TaxID=1761741 RepID=UPI001F0922D8|nr:hypothetical protein [Paenibacillus periandrae]
MATKSRNKTITSALVISMLLLGAVFLLSAIDFFKYKKDLMTDSYYQSTKLNYDIYMFYRLIQLYSIDPYYKDYLKKSPVDKIGLYNYNELKAQSDQETQSIEESLTQSYISKIDQAQMAGSKESINLLMEERNQKLAEARKTGERAFEGRIRQKVAELDDNYANMQRILDKYSGFYRYYIVDSSGQDVYTNMYPAPGGLEDLQKQSLYKDAGQRLHFPLSPNQLHSLPYTTFETSLQFMSRSFELLHLEGIFIIPEASMNTVFQNEDYGYYKNIREGIMKESLAGVVCLAVGIAIFLYVRTQGLLNLLSPSFVLYQKACALGC